MRVSQEHFHAVRKDAPAVERITMYGPLPGGRQNQESFWFQHSRHLRHENPGPLDVFETLAGDHDIKRVAFCLNLIGREHHEVNIWSGADVCANIGPSRRDQFSICPPPRVARQCTPDIEHLQGAIGVQISAKNRGHFLE